MALVLDFLVPEQDLGEAAEPSATPVMENADLEALTIALLEQPHPELLRAPPGLVKPRLRDDLWTDFFAVL
jgi:hypothetical protein